MPDSVKPENDLPPGAPAYSAGPLANTAVKATPTMGAALASGQGVTNFVAPKTPDPASPYGTNMFKQAPHWAANSSLVDRAKTLTQQATDGITRLLGLAGTAGASAAMDRDKDPAYRFVLQSEKRSGKDFLTGTNISDPTASLEDGLDELEKRSTKPKIPSAFEMRLLAQSK